MFYEAQLDAIRSLQGFLGPRCELFWNFFDSTPFYILVTLAVYFLTSVRSGIRFLSISLIDHVFVVLTKALFHMPRPCVFDPSISEVPCTSYAFPSGGGQAAMLFTLLFCYHVKNLYLRLLAVLFLLLASFARIYVGAHFFTDILGGWLFAALVFLVYVYIFPTLEKWVAKIPFYLFVVGSHLLLFTLLFFPIKKLVLSHFVLLSSLFLGLFVASSFHLLIRADEKWYKKVVLMLIGLGGLYLIPYNDPISFYPIGLWISLGSVCLLRLIFPKTPRFKESRFP